ncbi:patatin-like phospholipase family protein [Alteribacillus iranensis]|uniref:NTE family protein n=1 Tax=Alteribacillus iranensis TaxID=930128 RepID=A0A1I1ZG76_9BACI|nr:patatin-like phospholipase family protein [Alteribacillus iranensis]SFE30719.1 NTE family protein [Alteribacillus iranensis]
MRLDGVFAGGGVKAFAFIGALQVIEKKGYSFERVAGTSAGSIMAALIKAGYTAEELYSIFMPLQLDTLLEKNRMTTYFPWLSWFSIYWKLGLYKGDKLEYWLRELLARKKIYRFGDLPEGTLKIVASDVTGGRIFILPDDLPKYGRHPESFSIARAVKMSCMLPYVFQPDKLKTGKKKSSLIVDGGILSNFPIWLFKEGNVSKYKRPVIGFQLSPKLTEEQGSKDIHNGIQLYQSLFETMRKAHDLRYIDKNEAKNVVFLPADHIKSTQFDVSDEQRQELICKGRKATETFLKKWC